MTDKLKSCPFCGCTDNTCVTASGGEWVSLIIGGHGSIGLRVCLDCGLVYIEKNICKKIKKREGRQ